MNDRTPLDDSLQSIDALYTIRTAIALDNVNRSHLLAATDPFDDEGESLKTTTKAGAPRLRTRIPSHEAVDMFSPSILDREGILWR